MLGSISQVAAAIEVFENVSFTDPVKKGAVGKKIIEGLGGVSSASSWSEDTIKGFVNS